MALALGSGTGVDDQDSVQGSILPWPIWLLQTTVRSRTCARADFAPNGPTAQAKIRLARSLSLGQP
jgi:hypothetical protein